MKTQVNNTHITVQTTAKSWTERWEDVLEPVLITGALWLFYVVLFLGVIPGTLKAAFIAWAWWWNLAL